MGELEEEVGGEEEGHRQFDLMWIGRCFIFYFFLQTENTHTLNDSTQILMHVITADRETVPGEQANKRLNGSDGAGRGPRGTGHCATTDTQQEKMGVPLPRGLMCQGQSILCPTSPGWRTQDGRGRKGGGRVCVRSRRRQKVHMVCRHGVRAKNFHIDYHCWSPETLRFNFHRWFCQRRFELDELISFTAGIGQFEQCCYWLPVCTVISFVPCSFIQNSSITVNNRKKMTILKQKMETTKKKTRFVTF